MMKFVVVLVFVCHAYAEHEHAIKCTNSDFESTLRASPLSLVKFYAPWCGHCKKMAPEFESAAGELLQNDPPVTLIKVDCTSDADACTKYSVSGYPTLKIFRGLESEDYAGGRTAAEMVTTMKSKAGPISKSLLSVSAAEAYFNKLQAVAVVGYFSSDISVLANAYFTAANALSADYSFAHSTSADVLKKYDFSDSVVLYRLKRLSNKFEKTEVVFDGEKTNDALKAWVKSTANGLCGHRTTPDTDNYPMPLVVVYYKVDYVKDPKGTNYWRNRVMKVALKFKDVTFSINNKDDMAQEMEVFGLTAGEGTQPVVGMWDIEKKKYLMKEAFSMDNLEAFVLSVMEGAAEPYMKSEELPTGTDEGVQVLVAKNFKEIVNDNTKDVLIEFYAPWCGHCKSLAPKWAELAKKMADEDDIVIAKMDATANDVLPAYDVQGFPTIYFSPKDRKSSPELYSGAREVDDFIKYLAEKRKPKKEEF